jgi:predicted DNA binding CopG/RHH family protein
MGKEGKKYIMLRLEEDDMDRIKIQAKRVGLTMTAFVRSAVIEKVIILEGK